MSLAHGSLNGTIAPADDDSDTSLETLMADLPKPVLQRLVDQVNEMYQGWAALQRSVTSLNQRQNYADERLERLSSHPLLKRTTEVTLSNLEYDESPTGQHRVYRIPKAMIREEIEELAREEDAKTYRKIKGFFRKNSEKIASHFFFAVVVTTIMYVAHHLGWLGAETLHK